MGTIEEIIRRLTVFTNLYGLELWVRSLYETTEDNEQIYLIRVMFPMSNEYLEYGIDPEYITEDDIVGLMNDILAKSFIVTTTS